MDLIGKLREVAPHIPPSHVPVLNELAGVLGAAILHAEHGDALFEAAAEGITGIARLIDPAGAPAVEEAAQDAPQVAADVQALIAELESVKGQLAQAQRTQVSVQHPDPTSEGNS